MGNIWEIPNKDIVYSYRKSISKLQIFVLFNYKGGVSIGLIQQNIKVKITPYNKEHFKKLGYDTTKNLISVKVLDLPHGSGMKINVSCDYCGKSFLKEYRRFISSPNDVCCMECRKYKFYKTNVKRYGCGCTLRNKEIENKMIKNNLLKYGYKFPFEDKSVLEKSRETFAKNNFKKSINRSHISKQQRHIVNLYHAKISYPVGLYLLDGFFEKEKIYFEYDGAGHLLCVKMNIMSQCEFDKKENKRRLYLKNKGFKEFRIISDDDKLPEDNVLLEIKEQAFHYLIDMNYISCFYNINNKIWSFIKE